MNADTQGAWDIKFEDLTLGYEDHVVLDRINASLPGGEISVILGSSGGGKSTLLRHLVGLRRPMSGSIMLGPYNIFQLPQKAFRALRRRMGMLFQDGALLGSLTLAENVALPLREHTNLPFRVVRDAVMNTLEMVGLADFGAYYPNQLSGGMRKRAGLARAMITEPPILLCDEPTSGLDPISASQMDSLLLDLKKQKPEMTIVVVSHDIQSLYKIADHVLVLHAGGIAFNGSLKELEASDDVFLKGFLDRGADTAGKSAQKRYDLTNDDRRVIQKALDEWLDRH